MNRIQLPGSWIVAAISILVMIGAVTTPTSAQDPADPKAKKVDKPKVEKSAPKWAVVRVGAKLEVVAAAEVKPLQEKLAVEHKAATKEWNESKKEAKKNKEKFTDPKPKKKLVKVLAANFASKATADEHKTKLEEKARKKKDKGTQKKSKGTEKKSKGTEKKSDKKPKKKSDDEEDDGFLVR